MKMTKEQQVALRTKMKNYQARRKHEEKMNEIKRKSCEDLQSLRSSLDAKLTSAQIKHKNQMQQKEQELRKSKLEYDKKIRETKENQRKLEEEMLGWQTELLSYRKMQEQRAEEAAKDQVAKRKQKILEDRILRGKLQRENLEKLLSQDEDYRAELEASLAMKEARANALIAERDRIIQDSRAMSAASQRLRDEVRHHFSMNDLDQLNKQALMEARLGVRGSQTSLANQMSRVTLG
ncbi:hypothetical protein CAPTEDRAFT_21848 [Capitella teleta]|uniref:Uncharacterized protein n=1 Tax=Capitella teleta TaxID=283909 RepID=R7TK79_CAPTE|nr:hypothetical protein CAPTEDRAFT_21848 [Capitella teleta]|eukprot:ELT94223.1 hypothetical protein CAPTEDRAFT_21848 [Capitella teleta]